LNLPLTRSTFRRPFTRLSHVSVALITSNLEAFLAITDFNTNTEIFAGNGDSTFKSAKIYSAAGLALTDVADFNQDGSPDLLQLTFIGQGVTVLTNAR
jgi:hypothetical protein